MGLFFRCSIPDCTVTATFLWHTESEPTRTCERHAAEVEHSSSPVTLNIELTEEELGVLQCFQARMNEVHQAVVDLATLEKDDFVRAANKHEQDAEAALEEFEKQVQTIREQVDLDIAEIIENRRTPLNSRQSISYKITLLKQANLLKENELFHTAKRWLRGKFTYRQRFRELVTERGGLSPVQVIEEFNGSFRELHGCNFDKVNLAGANLTGCVFTNCSFVQCDLSKTLLKPGILFASSLVNANMLGASITPMIDLKPYQVETVAVSPCGKYFASGGRVCGCGESQISLHDSEKGKLELNYFEDVRALVFTPCSQYLLGGGESGTVVAWSLSTLVSAQEFPHQGEVCAIAVSPDGQFIAVSLLAGDKNFNLWEFASQTLVHSDTLHESFIADVTFSPSGKLLLTGGCDEKIKVWSVPDMQKVRSIAASGSFRCCPVRFIGGNTHFVCGGADARVQLIQIEDRVEEQSFTVQDQWVSSLAVSACGKYVAAGGYFSGTIELFDMVANKHLTTFSGHSGAVHSVAFSHDGKYIYSGSADCTVRMWLNMAKIQEDP